MKNEKIIISDETMENIEEGIEMDRIEPRLMKGNEPNILMGKDDSGNAIGIFDEFCGVDGQYVKEGNFKENYEIAMKNLSIHYYLNDFEFENLMEDQVYKFDCPNFTRTAKSIMLLKSVQDAVIDLVGDNPYFIVSGRGNLYISSTEIDLGVIIYPIFDNDKGRLEQELTFYTIDKNGKYQEERIILRGDY
jgi:hypothetical protein